MGNVRGVGVGERCDCHPKDDIAASLTLKSGNDARIAKNESD